MIEEHFESIGHQQQEPARGPRHLMQGPIVPPGELWTLVLIAAKNNINPNEYPTERTTPELVVCVFLPPRPSDHEESPPGEWVLLEGNANVPQFRPVKWEGYLELPAGSQLGAWFRGAEEGDVLELNAIYNVEVLEEAPNVTYSVTVARVPPFERGAYPSRP